MARPPARPHRPDSRARLLVAASREFAEHGFAATSVDRIAARARLNKAMIYYHFRSKAGIYQAILRELFGAVGTRVRAIADGEGEPSQKIHAFVDAMAREAAARPAVPPIMMREMVEHGRHLEPDTIRSLLEIPQAFAAIVQDGISVGAFRSVDPLLAYFSVIAPIVFVVASAPMRRTVTRAAGIDLPDPSLEALIGHVQSVALNMLRAQTPPRERGVRNVS